MSSARREGSCTILEVFGRTRLGLELMTGRKADALPLGHHTGELKMTNPLKIWIYQKFPGVFIICVHRCKLSKFHGPVESHCALAKNLSQSFLGNSHVRAPFSTYATQATLANAKELCIGKREVNMI